MVRHTMIGFVLLFIFFTSVYGDEAGYDEYTILLSDIPADAPRFEDYATELYRGPNAEPDLRSHPR
jgi:hypothetical protein